MATANMTVSLDPAVIALAKAQAAEHGMAASAWVAKLIRDAAVTEAGRRYDAYNRDAADTEAMALWDAANDTEQAERLAGAEW
jgi:ribonuclease HII